MPKKFKNHYDFPESKKLHPNTNENAYSWVTIKILSRCSHSAADKALQELNFWIGILNIFYNYNQNRISLSIPQPINKIRSFPYHSLHLESGEKATTEYWYNLNHSINGTSIHADENFKLAMKFFNKIKKNIIKTKKYDLFLSILNRYCDSLETSDMNRSFLGLWSLLEQITFTGKNTYDVTINRAIFIFKDKFLTKQILETLRNKRNMAIHTGETFEEGEKYTYLLLSIVNKYIIFLVDTFQKVNSKEKLINILDLPTENQKLVQLNQEHMTHIEDIKLLRKIIRVDE